MNFNGKLSKAFVGILRLIGVLLIILVLLFIIKWRMNHMFSMIDRKSVV